MKILDCQSKNNILRVMVDTNEENLFYLLKTYLNEDKSVEVCGVFKEHHLIEKTEFLLKIKSGDAKVFFKKKLSVIKKELNKLKIK